MFYKVENCVCDYSVVLIKDDGTKQLIDILNSVTNAQLICDILNADMRHEIYRDNN